MKIIDKYRSLPKSLKASIWFMLCSMIQKGITFLTTPIFTRLLSAEEFGKYSLFLSWQEVLIIFATLNLNYQIFNNGMIKYKNDKDGYTTSMTGLAFVSSLIVFTALSIIHPIFYQYTGIDRLSLLLMAINMYSVVVYGLWIVRNRYDFSYKAATAMTVGLALLNPILGILLVRISEQKVLFRIISLTISTLAVALIAFFLLLRKSKALYNKSYWKYALKLSIPLIPHYLSMVILHSADRIMIGALDNESSVAYYSISYNVALVMQIILNAINASFIPWVYQKMEKKDYAKIKKYNSLIILFVAIISMIPMLLAPEAVMILGGSEYLSAVSIVPILSSSVFLIYLYSTFIIIETYLEKNIYITLGSTAAAILNIVLNAILIPRIGYKAAAYTTLISYMALATFHWFMYSKALKSKNITKEVFNVKLMVVVSIVLLAFSVAMSFVYKMLVLRILLVCLVGLIIVLNRKKIVFSLRELKKGKKK